MDDILKVCETFITILSLTTLKKKIKKPQSIFKCLPFTLFKLTMTLPVTQQGGVGASHLRAGRICAFTKSAGNWPLPRMLGSKFACKQVMIKHKTLT